MAVKFVDTSQSFPRPKMGQVSSIRPAEGSAGFEYHSDRPEDQVIFSYLNEEVLSWPFPNTPYEPITNKVFVTSEVAEFERLAEEHRPAKDQVITLIHNPGHSAIAVSNQRDYRCRIIAGDDFVGVMQKVVERSNTKSFSYGLDDLLGYGYLAQLNQIIREGTLDIQGLQEGIGFLKLNAVWNSYGACTNFLYDKLSSTGLIFDSVESLIDKVVSEAKFDQLFQDIATQVLQKKEPEALFFGQQAQAKLDELHHILNLVLSYLPDLDFLLDLFWERFNALLQNSKQFYDFLVRFAKAKTTFDQTFYQALGTEGFNQLFGSQGKKLMDSSDKFVELMIGGGLFGAVPFLIGTLYQIIYDLVMLVINLCWYAYWSASGVVAWLFKPDQTASEQEERIAADKSVLDMFTFGFNLDDIPGQLTKISGYLIGLLKDAVDSFIDHAAEYGKTVGGIVASGTIIIANGALSLITSGYPPKPTLWNRIWYITKQWFNIGCLLGPIIVDIVLLFCSGGVSGIFSGATKLSKLDKVGDGFRFFYKTKAFLEKASFVKQFQKRIPGELITLLQRLLSQLASITRSIKDQIRALLRAANGAFGKSKKAWDDVEIEQLARKLDQWYDIAGVVDLFAAIAYFFIGGTDAQINEQGKVVAT
ncbi:MAG: hypothetical protein AAFZ63_27920 [Bacteroidota bacterium]